MKKFEVGQSVRLTTPSDYLCVGNVYRVQDVAPSCGYIRIEDRWHDIEKFEPFEPVRKAPELHWSDLALIAMTQTGRITPPFGEQLLPKLSATVKDAEKVAAAIKAEADAAATRVVQEAAARAEATQKLAAANAAKQAVRDRLAYQRGLAQATDSLLGRIGAVLDGGTVSNYEAFAKFRKELQPLASTYGIKIVLVGDKTQATLVKV